MGTSTGKSPWIGDIDQMLRGIERGSVRFGRRRADRTAWQRALDQGGVARGAHTVPMGRGVADDEATGDATTGPIRAEAPTAGDPATERPGDDGNPTAEQTAAALPGEPAPPDDAPLEPEPPVPPARVEPTVVPRWMQVVGLTVALLGLSALVRASRPVLLIFIVAGVISLILNPLVKLVQRAGLWRGAAIAVVFVGFFAAIAGSIALLVNPVSDQIAAFREDLPNLIDSANASLLSLQGWLDDRGLDVQIARRGQTALETLNSNVVSGSGDILAFTRDLVTILIEASFALVLILVIAIYMLLYGKQIGALVRRVMPEGDGTPEDDFPIRAQKAVFGYVRGQLAFSLIMGVSAGISLWVFGALGIFPSGQTYAVFFGVFYGLMELIPYIGPVIGAAPPVIVALFQGEPLTALWLVLLFLALQQLEGHVVAPQVFSQALRINPLVVIFVLLLGGHLHGIIGALVALPLAAIVRETWIYLRRHVVLEPWGTPSAQAIAEGPPATVEVPVAALGVGQPTEVLPAIPVAAAVGVRSVRRRCPECAAVSDISAGFCWACGTALRPQRRTRDGESAPPPAAPSSEHDADGRVGAPRAWVAALPSRGGPAVRRGIRRLRTPLRRSPPGA